ncbi:MAG: hypothetical protein KDN19_15740 [Verrucomicrobiae bacterium]|nr:hypothetical protein [Verrucomicrobiae bacterium]
MKRVSVFFLGGFAMLSMTWAQDGAVDPAPNPEVAAVRNQFEEALVPIAAPWQKLREQYQARLAELQRDYVAKGDLATVLAVKGETTALDEGRASDLGQFPDLKAVQEIFLREKQRLGDEAAPKVETLMKAYAEALEKRQVELTKAGDIEAAEAVLKEGERIRRVIESGKGMAKETGLAFLEPVEAAAADTIPSSPAPAGGVNDPFQKKQWPDDLKIGPGVFGGNKEVVVIKPAEERGALPTIEIVPGTVIRDAALLVDDGKFLAERSLFDRSRLMVDLGGQFTATDCLFNACDIEKGGAWTRKFWSSLWSFENCVFARGFIKGWTMRRVGLKMDRCTIYDTTFDTLEYVADASNEVGKDGFMIEDTRFVNCRIPLSVLITTDDCYFENCEFIDDGESILGNRRVSVKLTVNEEKQPIPNSQGARFSITVEQKMMSDTGARLPHRYEGGRLAFETSN